MQCTTKHPYFTCRVRSIFIRYFRNKSSLARLDLERKLITSKLINLYCTIQSLIIMDARPTNFSADQPIRVTSSMIIGRRDNTSRDEC